MKTFEEKYTAWIDGELSGRELADFQRELAAVENAEADRMAAHRLGDLIREHVTVPKLAHADFFNHQLLQQIAADEPRGNAPAGRAPFWTLPRMAWAGACCLLLAFGLYLEIIPKTEREVSGGQEYVARILSAQSDDPAISATAYHDNDENVTVLWLDGLKYIPADRKLK